MLARTLLSVAVATVLTSVAAEADLNYLEGCGDFSAGSCWQGGVTPSAGDKVAFNNAGRVYVDSYDSAVNGVSISGGSTQFYLSSWEEQPFRTGDLSVTRVNDWQQTSFELESGAMQSRRASLAGAEVRLQQRSSWKVEQTIKLIDNSYLAVDAGSRLEANRVALDGHAGLYIAGELQSTTLVVGGGAGMSQVFIDGYANTQANAVIGSGLASSGSQVDIYGGYNDNNDWAQRGWDVGGDLIVGDNSMNNLLEVNRGRLMADRLLIGNSTEGYGNTLRVSGGEAWDDFIPRQQQRSNLESRELLVGVGSVKSTLEITEGAIVRTSERGVVGTSYDEMDDLGFINMPSNPNNEDFSNRVRVSKGARWEVANLSIEGLPVMGIVDVDSGGVVSTDNIAVNMGELNVSGQGSRVESRERADFNGRVNVENGALLETREAYVGVAVDDGQSYGDVSIRGEGSRWLNTGRLSIGSANHEGNAHVMIADGGLLRSGDTIVGGSTNNDSGWNQPQRQGRDEVVVDRARWESTGTVVVGGQQEGLQGETDAVINLWSSTLTVAEALVIEESGAVNVYDSTIEADSLVIAGSLELESGTLAVNSVTGDLTLGESMTLQDAGAGAIIIDGDYQQDGGTLLVDLDSINNEAFSYTDVSGRADITGGILSLNLGETMMFDTEGNYSFNLFSAEELIGEFDLLLSDILADDLIVTLRYMIDFEGGSTDIVQLTVSQVPLPASGWLFFSALAGLLLRSRRSSLRH